MVKTLKGQAQAKRDGAPIMQADIELARSLLTQAPAELLQAGQDWYPLVNARVRMWAQETGYSVEQVAATIALYSMNQTWNGNVTLARQALYDGIVVGIGNATRRVQAVLGGADIDAQLVDLPKIGNFYSNILLRDGVTIDRWMVRLFGKDKPSKWYVYCARCVEYLALEYGCKPYEMQAMLWVLYIAHSGRSMAYYLVASA